MVEMLRIDVGDHGDGRVQLGERTVALVGLDNHPLAAAKAGIASPSGDDAAIDHRRIDAGAVQQGRHQRGGRRLAMCAGNGHRPAKPHQLAKHFGAVHDWDEPLARGHDFGIVGLDRGRDHHDRGIGHILGGLAADDLDALVAKAAHIGVFRAVASLHLIAELEQDFGDAAHADAADAGEMQGADGQGKFTHRALLLSPLAARSRA